MAEVTGQGQPGPGAAQNQPAPQPQPTAAGQQPAAQPTASPSYPWSSDQRFKETDPEAFYKGYQELEKKVGNHSQLEQFAQQINEYAKQFGGLEALAQYANYGAQQWQQAQRGGQQQQQPAQGQQPNPYERWDLLTPQEQASLLQQQVLGQVNNYGQNLANELRTALEQKIAETLGGVHRQMDIFSRVISKKLENPALNVNDVLQQMVKLTQQGSDPNALMEFAINNMTLEQQIAQKVNEQVQARLADEKNKAQNASLQALTTPRPTGAAPEASGPRSSEDRKRSILSKGLSAGWLNPSQI